ncbi:MAG: hypothetical protein Q7S40_25355, partial [Opitutaceae bacterium]|nr:hypothetical protein [Opitutaceae bacterium]
MRRKVATYAGSRLPKTSTCTRQQGGGGILPQIRAAKPHAAPISSWARTPAGTPFQSINPASGLLIWNASR